ncbi:TonB-dependent receptor [Hyphomicrobium sulfonivorans]|uniref:TonB-dependent receptor n=1 Tax=Hyphomicrobium sulfonivorans TaxID=121290 RepID=UPI001570327C|nr:TonB-dependent receptor [Hyphomicrobium sulfonivorans]MBI1650867.1 TonB-dependent hemoglobin/transferrin/lactoferrin family receptor [Hyphomicrobium sulfonivorans]NSL72752.1 TonB-dependent heme/hemoglobin receptor family protein [Hyphomicrobium sulfonivorans]
MYAFTSARFAALLLVGCAAVMEAGVGHGAAAQQANSTSVYTFNLPAQKIAQGVNAIGRAAGLSVVINGKVDAALQGQAVSGSMTAAQAFATFLGGTGLTYSFTNGNTVTVSGASADSGGATVDGAIALDTIDVSGGAASAGFQGTPDWVYEAPASVSVISREAIKTVPTRDTRDLLSNAAGVYSGEGNGSFPTVSPNIRGLQDSGRVVVSVDGARQNAQRGMGFGTGMGSYGSNSGQAFVDSAFIREVDIAKTTDAKAGSAGSLGGRVDFRTVGADDLIAPGAKTGVELNVLRGTNEYDFQGSALAAFRLTDTLSLTAGFSKLKLGEYQPGKNGDARSFNDALGRETWSSFQKLEFDNREGLTASLSWMHQDIKFAYAMEGIGGNIEHVRNDTVVGKINWNPETEMIDLKTNLWFNNSRNDELRESRRSSPTSNQPPDTYLDLDTQSFGGTLENTSRLETAAGLLTLNYGAEAFRDKASSSANSETIALNPLWETSYTAFNPPGQRDVASTFINGELKPADWLTVSGGLRYDWSRLRGTPTYYENHSYKEAIIVPCDELSNHYTAEEYWPIFLAGNPTWSSRYALYLSRWSTSFGKGCMPGTGMTTYNDVVSFPGHQLDIDRTDSAWLPSATIELKPVDWFRPFASYSQSYRPPTTLEAFFAGGTPGDGVGTAYAPNADLQGERGETYEVGANIIRDGLFRDNDSLRMKMAAFHRDIEDYIVMGSLVTDATPTRLAPYSSFVNMDGTTTMRGIEVEANYDMRVAYIGAAATWLDTKWPGKTDIFSNGILTTNGDVVAVAGNIPPDFKLTVDGGIRLMDERLTIGARYTHTSPTKTRQVTTIGANMTVVESTDPYSVFDLYSVYQANENITLRLSVNNVTDQRYVPAGGLFLAPGRTATMGLTAKF